MDREPLESCSGSLWKRLLLGGGRSLTHHRWQLNRLNIFPIPDGDTGSNMSFTMAGALQALRALPPDSALDKVVQAAARGALRCAHGNSGLILSQILAALATSLEGLAAARAQDLVLAWEEASRAAYRSIFNPSEGTILTVVRLIAQAGRRYLEETPNPNLLTLLERFLAGAAEGLESYRQGPEILRQGQVVDAGGLGLYYLLEGAHWVAQGRPWAQLPSSLLAEKGALPLSPAAAQLSQRYCLEFLLEQSALSPRELAPRLEGWGNSLVISQLGEQVKVHLHSNYPERVAEILANYGPLSQRKVEDLAPQCLEHERHLHWQAAPETPAPLLERLWRPSPKERQLNNWPPLFICLQGAGWAEYFQEGWGWEVYSRDLSGEQPAQLLAPLSAWAANFPTSTPLGGVAFSPQEAEILAQGAVLAQVRLSILSLASPLQLLVALLHQPPLPWGLELAQIPWGALRAQGDHFQLWQDGIYQGEANSLELGVELYLEGLPAPKRLLLAPGRGLEPALLEQSLAYLWARHPALSVQVLYGGQKREAILIYGE